MPRNDGATPEMSDTRPATRHNGDVRTHSLGAKSGLSGIRRMIRADLNRAGTDPAVSFDCLVAVTEACTTALEEVSELAEVSWAIERRCARFFVSGFSTQEWSRATHPSRDEDEPLEEVERRVAGIGIELMRALMDEVNVKVGPAGTTLELVKNFA